MNWPDERYVRVYTRDTADWLALSYEAQGLLALIFRKVDRSGVMDLGRHGRRAVAISVGHPHRSDLIDAALEELLVDGCVCLEGNRLLVPNFIEAQEAKQSDKARQRESRERRRSFTVAKTEPVSRNVTNGHETQPNVTAGHTVSHGVTPYLAVPSRAVPERDSRKTKPPKQATLPDFPPEPETILDDSWKFECSTVHERFKQSFGAPNAPFAGREAKALSAIRKTKPLADVLAMIDRLADDEWVRSNKSLAWCLGPEGIDKGTRKANSRNGPSSTTDYNKPLPPELKSYDPNEPPAKDPFQ